MAFFPTCIVKAVNKIYSEKKKLSKEIFLDSPSLTEGNPLLFALIGSLRLRIKLCILYGLLFAVKIFLGTADGFENKRLVAMVEVSAYGGVMCVYHCLCRIQ